MNRSGINSSQINGQRLAGWVVSAAAIVSAGVTSEAYAQRFFGAAAYGDAAAVVTLTSAHNIAARCNALAGATSSVKPTTIFFGTATTRCEAMGNGAVLRNVAGLASADGTAYGEALAADQLGDSLAAAITASAADAHVVHPGRVSILGEGAGSGLGLAIRMSPAIGLALGRGFGEATMQLSGEDFQRLDGFAKASSTATPILRNDYTAIIATYGAFDFGRTLTAEGRAAIRYQAASYALGVASTQSEALRTQPGFATGLATCNSQANYTMTSPVLAAGAASVRCYLADADQLYRGRASGAASALGQPAKFNTKFHGGVNGKGEAVFFAPLTARHHFGAAVASCASQGVTPLGDVAILGASRAFGGGSGSAFPANFHRALAGSVSTAMTAVTPADHQFAQAGSVGSVLITASAKRHEASVPFLAIGTGTSRADYSQHYFSSVEAKARSTASSLEILYFNHKGEADSRALASGLADPYYQRASAVEPARAGSIGFAVPADFERGAVLARSEATSFARPADIRRGSATAIAGAVATVGRPRMHLSGKSLAAAEGSGLVGGTHHRAPGVTPAFAGSVGYAKTADFRRGAVLATAGAGASVKVTVLHLASAKAFAVASGTSLAQSNVDVLAPASRAMTISVEERAMFVPEENRTMTEES